LGGADNTRFGQCGDYKMDGAHKIMVKIGFDPNQFNTYPKREFWIMRLAPSLLGVTPSFLYVRIISLYTKKDGVTPNRDGVNPIHRDFFIKAQIKKGFGSQKGSDVHISRAREWEDLH
jgi:hypothetical protein